MLIGSLLRFSSDKDRSKDSHDESDDVMTRPTKKLASITDQSIEQADSRIDAERPSLDELATMARKLLLDENLEVSKVRPFFWTMVETYIDRFQIFPFDAVKALFSYLELHDYPEEEVRNLVRRLEQGYTNQHGATLRCPGIPAHGDSAGKVTLDDEINELRQTLKYAAMVGERTDDET